MLITFLFISINVEFKLVVCSGRDASRRDGLRRKKRVNMTRQDETVFSLTGFLC